MPITLKTNSFKYRDDSSDEWSSALVQATAPLDPAFEEIGKLASELGIVVDGNTATVNIAAGQYIILRNSTISGFSDGLYTATQAIPANTVVSGTDLTAVNNGGLNKLSDKLPHVQKYTASNKSCTAGAYTLLISVPKDSLPDNFLAVGFHDFNTSKSGNYQDAFFAGNNSSAPTSTIIRMLRNLSQSNGGGAPLVSVINKASDVGNYAAFNYVTYAGVADTATKISLYIVNLG